VVAEAGVETAMNSCLELVASSVRCTAACTCRGFEQATTGALLNLKHCVPSCRLSLVQRGIGSSSK